MVFVQGMHGTSSRVLQHSITASGIQFITFENEKWRGILAEENTHRSLSKNSASSRAIPFKKMAQQLTGRPVRFGQANPGMQDKGVDFDAPVNIGKVLGFGHDHFVSPEEAWELAGKVATNFSEAFYDAGYHKQVYNRLTEAHQMMKTVLSGTELANFFWLRDHDAADPSIAELARCMREAKEASLPMLIHPGEWHLPYVDRYRDAEGVLHYGDEVFEGTDVKWIEYSLQDAIKISAARCAAVSFRNVDYGLEKCLEVHERLVGDDRKHASALEHQATPMEAEHIGDLVFGPETAEAPFGTIYREMTNIPERPDTWQEGISHMDKNRQLWSGNIRGYIQYRKLVPGENYTG